MQMPSNDPKFQKWVILEGAGKSIREELMIFKMGVFFRAKSI
jgi:hypothetical protein